MTGDVTFRSSRQNAVYLGEFSKGAMIGYMWFCQPTYDKGGVRARPRRTPGLRSRFVHLRCVVVSQSGVFGATASPTGFWPHPQPVAGMRAWPVGFPAAR